MGRFIKDVFSVRELSNMYPYTSDFNIILFDNEAILRDRLLRCENVVELVNCYEQYIQTPM